MTRPHVAGWVALAIVVAAATAARLALFHAGPDLDSDSYGHAVIGRTLLLAPTDLRQHWVWLPLWHYVFMGLALVGRGLDEVRLVNVACSALTPLLLARAVEIDLAARPSPSRSRRQVEAVVPFFAGVLACLWPLALDHGQSGEPEPVFAALLIGACLAVDRGRAWLGGLVLGIACLLRYEAWAVLPAFGVASVLRARGGAAILPVARTWVRESGAWFVPALVIGAWIVAHQRATGEWLQFLRINREFARAARATAVPGVGPEPTAWWYAVTLPQWNLGDAVLLAVPGAVWFFRRAPLSMKLVGPALLAFVTYGWVRQQHLGLDRHLYAVVPFYSLAVAGGAAQLASAAIHLSPARLARAIVWGHAALCFWVGVRTMRYFTVPAYDRLVRAHAAAWADERRAAELVVARQPARVMCDLPRVEVFSKLPPDRFVRVGVADLASPDAAAEARVFGKAYIVARPDRFKRLEGQGVDLMATADVRVVEWATPP